MSFNHLKVAVQARFNAIKDKPLFVVDVDKGELWWAYLLSIPEDQRQEYSCNCCEQFIRNYAGVVAIEDNRLQTLWDFEGHLTGDTKTTFGEAVINLHQLVFSAKIRHTFVSKHTALGTDKNHYLVEGIAKEWSHFSVTLSEEKRYKGSKSIASITGQVATDQAVFKRGLDELKLEAAKAVLELIDQNQLYRGLANKHAVQRFISLKTAYFDLQSEREEELFCWSQDTPAGRIRNTSIGTLIQDLSEGISTDQAVKKFEAMVAPSNYKRPTALVTQGMIAKAQEAVTELGYAASLERQYATTDDIPVSEAIYTDRSHDPLIQTNVFDEMSEDLPVNPRKFSKVKEVSIEDFLNQIVPTASSIEVLLEARHAESMVTLVAPASVGSLSMFPWDNALSWAYSGGMADSMKQRVKEAGGRVDGVLRYSLQWNEGMRDKYIDFDIHCVEPSGNLISYPTAGRKQASSGMLDVDNTSPGSSIAVENIIWTDREKMREGEYKLLVHNYSSSNSVGGFQAEVEFGGVTHVFAYDKPLKGGEKVNVASVKLDNYEHFTIEPKLPKGSAEVSSRKIWGLGTNKFHKVSTVMKSPNYWGSNASGNEHTFFIVESALAEESPRGVFNEFLKPELHEHRKVFEMLANKMAVKPLAKGEQELSGLGFSSTQRNEVIVRVITGIGGGADKVIRVKF